MEEMQRERHVGVHVMKVKDLNVKTSYSLLVYIGFSFLEFGVFILLQDLTYTQSISVEKKESSLSEYMNYETPIFTVMQKSFQFSLLFCYFHPYTFLLFLFYSCSTTLFPLSLSRVDIYILIRVFRPSQNRVLFLKKITN